MSPQEHVEAYQFLLDKYWRGVAEASVVVPADLDEAALGSLLREVFVADGSLTAVSLRIDDTTIGTVTRGRLLLLTDPDSRGVSEGDGAELPGRSMRYRLLAYSCRTASCPTVEWHVVAPDRLLHCPHGHGPLGHDT